MPVHLNKIGDFEFLDIEGSPYLLQQQKELVERHGVDGSGARKTGKRGKPFQIQTTNYVESFEEAKSLMDQYKELADEDPVELIRQTVSEGNFIVLEVVERDRFAIWNAIGGVQADPNNPVIHECCQLVVWTLLEIE